MGQQMNEYIDIALVEARKAGLRGEVPIGAVIVRNGKVIARGRNMRERKQNALYHAEIIAINKACKKLGSWRLDDCEMYVTLEPCAMCMGALVNARVKAVYAGAPSTTDLNWKTPLVYIENKECAKLLKDFFASKR